MSELLDRIETEIRERLAATREAMLEHERSQAALDALTGAVEEPHAVKGGARSRAPRRGARDGFGARPPAERPVDLPQTGLGRLLHGYVDGHHAAQTDRPCLRVIEERPGVTAAELSVASGVHRGTLSALLRTLVDRGELEKRPLTGGRTGYARAAAEPLPAASGSEPVPASASAAKSAAEPKAASGDETRGETAGTESES